MNILRTWEHIDDVEPDEIERSDSYGPFTKGDIVKVEGRSRATFKFHQHTVNKTRDDEYVHLVGITPTANFGKNYLVAPSQLVQDT